MADTSKKVVCILSLLEALINPESHRYSAVKNLLFGAFDSYRETQQSVSNDQRPQIEKLLLKSLPAVEDGLKDVLRGFNPDKRVEAQGCLSGLQFLVDDFGKSLPQLDDIARSDVVNDLREEIEITADSATYGKTEIPDLRHVPKTHVWWKHEFNS